MGEQLQKKNKTGHKIAAVIMSLLLWFYVINEGNVASGGKMIEVQLQYYNVPADLNVTGPNKVAVKIWGAYKDNTDIGAYIDLAGLNKGEYQVPVKLQAVEGALFTSVQPNKVTITLEELGERVVAIKHEVKQNPAVGYQLSQVLLSPDNCMVKGDADAIARVAGVVAPIELGNVKDIANVKSTLQARDINGKTISSGIQILPSSINVYVVLEKKQLSKKVNIKPQMSGKVADGFTLGEVKSDPLQVTILGEQTQVESLIEILTKPIDLTGRSEDFSQLVDLVLPEGMAVLPSQVTVQVKISQTGGTP